MEPQRFTLTTTGTARLLGADDAPLTAAAVLDLPAGEYRWVSDPCILTMDVVLSAWGGKVVFESGGFATRELPLPFGAVLQTGPAHDGAHPVGRIDAVTPDGLRVVAAGWVTVGEGDDDPGRQYALALANGNMRSVSVDAEVLTYTDVYTLDAEGYPVDVTCVAHSWRIGGLTAVNMGADPDARVRLETGDMPDDAEAEDVEEDEEEETPAMAATGYVHVEGAITHHDGGVYVDGVRVIRGVTPEDAPAAASAEAEAITAAVATAHKRPPAEWFDNPNLTGPTPLTIEASGRVFGHIAPWDMPGKQKACHVGYSDRCVCAPPSPDGEYPYMKSGGTTLCADGSKVDTCIIAYLGGHPDDDGSQPWTTIKAAYDDPGNAGLIVNIGEDKHGVWIAGMVAPTRSPAEVDVMRVCGVSGHWRARIQGDPKRGARLIGACCVLSEGFPKQVITAAIGSDAELPAVASAPVAVYDEDGLVALTASTGTAVLAAAHEPADRGTVQALAERLAQVEALAARQGAMLDVLGPAIRQHGLAALTD